MTTFPKINSGQYLVFASDVTTGVMLNEQGEFHLQGQKYLYRVFDSLPEAKYFAKAEVKRNSKFEMTILDSNENFMGIVRGNR